MDQAAAGGGGELVVCDLWDRCWCVLELAVRYLAEKKVACACGCACMRIDMCVREKGVGGGGRGAGCGGGEGRGGMRAGSQWSRLLRRREAGSAGFFWRRYNIKVLCRNGLAVAGEELLGMGG